MKKGFTIEKSFVCLILVCFMLIVLTTPVIAASGERYGYANFFASWTTSDTSATISAKSDASTSMYAEIFGDVYVNSVRVDSFYAADSTDSKSSVFARASRRAGTIKDGYAVALRQSDNQRISFTIY